MRQVAICLADITAKGKQSVHPDALQIAVRMNIFLPEPGLKGPTIPRDMHSNGLKIGCLHMGAFQ